MVSRFLVALDGKSQLKIRQAHPNILAVGERNGTGPEEMSVAH